MVKRTNNDPSNTTYQTKDLATPTPLKVSDYLRFSERVIRSCSFSDTRHVTLLTGDKSRIGKGSDSEYDKWNMFLVICDTDIP
jgi:hypothetical protein